MPENKFPRIDIVGAVVVFFVLLFLFAKFGPSIPFSVVQTATTNPAPFSVSAEGKVTAVPDIAEITVGFNSTGASVGDVQDQANRTINTVSTAVKKLGIADKDIKTTNYSIYPTYDYRSNIQRITGYSINVSLGIKVRDFSKINSVIDASTTNGANQVSGLNFTFDDVEKYQAQARKLAIDKAKRKASDTANAAGITLGKLINVSENSSYYPRPMAYDMLKSSVSAGGGGEPTKVEAGSSEISVDVTLSYEVR